MNVDFHTTSLLVGGSLVRFDAPPKLLELAKAAELTRKDRKNARFVSELGASAWRRAAIFSQGGAASLNISVLGASVTSGCGSSEARHSSRCQNLSMALSRSCNLKGGWVRHMHDHLAKRLQGAGQGSEPSTNVHFRNAVGMSYFTHCTCQFVDRSTHVIVLDIAQVDAPASQMAHLPTLTSALRRCAPEAALVLVVWPSRSRLRNDGALLERLTQTALGLGLDVLRMDKLLLVVERSLHLHNHSNGWCRSTSAFTYAQRGSDTIHPSPEGHQLLGSEVATFVFDRVMSATSVSTVAAWRASGAAEPFREERKEDHWEACFSADRLPVRETDAWTLVDEGGDKGVPKLGLLSSHIGDVLTLGPFGLPGGVNCSQSRCRFQVEVGYLLSPRVVQGAFVIGCDHCHCAREWSTFAKQLRPFPGVDTYSGLNTNPHYQDAEFNASITATTVFDMEWRGGKQCLLSITHAPPGAGLSAKFKRAGCKACEELARKRNDSSRVRIDSLNIVASSSRQKMG